MLAVSVTFRNNIIHDTDLSYAPDSWFREDFKPDWFDDPIVRNIIEDIDGNEFKKMPDNGDGAWNSNYIMKGFWGYIDPSYISTGSKCLILIYKTDRLIKCKSLGDNCFDWLIKIGDLKDVKIEFDVVRPLKVNKSAVGVKLLETGIIYNDNKKFAYDMLTVAGY